MNLVENKKIEYWKSQLLDTGKRNKMIKFSDVGAYRRAWQGADVSRQFQRAGIRQGETCRDEAENIRSEDAGETKDQESGSKFIKFYGKSR